jgi:RNA polymerase sigma-70 factor, ECF subfamily
MPLDEEEIRRLITAIQAGIDVEASFAHVFSLSYRPVHSFFLRKGFSRSEAEDLTQDVFLRVYQGIGAFRHRSRFATWLFEITAHVYLNEIRRRGTGKRRGVEQSLDADTEDNLRELHEKVSRQSTAPQGPLEDLLEKERLDRLRVAIVEMPPQMRRCFFLRYLRGYKYREIAYLMKISIQTVRAHLHQARERLKLDLADEAEE